MKEFKHVIWASVTFHHNSINTNKRLHCEYYTGHWCGRCVVQGMVVIVMVGIENCHHNYHLSPPLYLNITKQPHFLVLVWPDHSYLHYHKSIQTQWLKQWVWPLKVGFLIIDSVLLIKLLAGGIACVGKTKIKFCPYFSSIVGHRDSTLSIIQSVKWEKLLALNWSVSVSTVVD